LSAIFHKKAKIKSKRSSKKDNARFGRPKRAKGQSVQKS
jgi:hypothetical protein